MCSQILLRGLRYLIFRSETLNLVINVLFLCFFLGGGALELFLASPSNFPVISVGSFYSLSEPSVIKSLENQCKKIPQETKK